MNVLKVFFIFFISQLLYSCSEQESDTENKVVVNSNNQKDTGLLPVVIESFNVGENVYVRSLKIDPDNKSLWVGTSVGALKIDLATGELLKTFTRDDGLANEYIFAIGIDHLGNKWFGTNAGGVSKYNEGEWQTFFPLHGLADYWVYSFAEQKNGSFWIGTWAGANKVDLKTMKFTTYVKELVNEWVYAIDVDSTDRVWFGTEGGISMFDGDVWSEWTHKDGLGAENTLNLPISSNTGLGTRNRHELSVITEGKETYNPNYVFALHVAPDDSIWAGTWGAGVSHFDGTAWTNLTVNDGLSGNIVYSLAQSDDGVFWFGTNHGLTRFDGTNWHRYDVHDGLLGNDIYAIAITDEGDIWAGTKNGVARLGTKSQK